MTHLAHFDRHDGPERRLAATPAAPARAGRVGAAAVFRIALVYAGLAAGFLVASHLVRGGDYVGFDNDDVMRLVEVRDFLGGQGWYDMHQYRLGLDGGTLMHWSRLIDLPIALLIRAFSAFLAPHQAEAFALVVWPSLALVFLLFGMGLAAARLGGRGAMHAALVLTGLYAVAINRFEPGAIDHTNVQLGLMAMLSAMLIARPRQAASYATAGLVCGVAVAIGAETTPLVAVACAVVALSWAIEGAVMTRAAQVFGLSFAATLTAAFYILVPPSRYSVVTCDALSTGFYVLGTSGGILLFAATVAVAGRSGLRARLAALSLCGGIIAALALTVTPQCLGNPLAGLDPLLKRMWLDHVSEAQPIGALVLREPFTFLTYYIVPALAAVVAAIRIRLGDRRRAHAILLALVAVALGVTVVQVRGSVFANILAFIVMAAAIADARKAYHARPRHTASALLFVGATLASVPAVWAFGGGLLAIAVGRPQKAETTGKESCASEAAMAPLAAFPGATVAAPSNLGVDILRYTQARALSAPYHRNPQGMLAELKIGMASPDAAAAQIAASGASIVAYCPAEAETRTIEHAAPRGLFAALARGAAPAYLALLPQTAEGPLQLYRFVARK